jgi:hypothetical protein
MNAEEKRAKHTAYMREWYKRKPGYKSSADRKYREKYREKLNEYDRKRSQFDAVRIANRKRYNDTYLELRKVPGPVREKHLAYCKSYYEKNKDYYRQKEKARRARYTEQQWHALQRRYGLKHRHKLTPEQRDEMLLAQGGVCAICGGPPNGRQKRFHVDHDHNTGVRRGLLCSACNFAMARVDHCPGWLLAAAKYRLRGKR